MCASPLNCMCIGICLLFCFIRFGNSSPWPNETNTIREILTPFALLDTLSCANFWDFEFICRLDVCNDKLTWILCKYVMISYYRTKLVWQAHDKTHYISTNNKQMWMLSYRNFHKFQPSVMYFVGMVKIENWWWMSTDYLCNLDGSILLFAII